MYYSCPNSTSDWLRLDLTIYLQEIQEIEDIVNNALGYNQQMPEYRKLYGTNNLISSTNKWRGKKGEEKWEREKEKKERNDTLKFKRCINQIQSVDFGSWVEQIVKKYIHTQTYTYVYVHMYILKKTGLSS